MSHLIPSAIFSPSLARAQERSSKDWNYIDAWLSRHYSSLTPSKTPPPFERTPETLKYLLALASLNESADEEAELLSLAQARCLQDLTSQAEAEPHVELLGTLEDGLTSEGETALDTLANLSVVLGEPVPADVETLGRGIIDLQVTSNNLAQTSERISILEAHLADELEHIHSIIADLQSEAYQPHPDLAKQTIDYQRKAKALASKLPELKDRVAGLSASASGQRITIQDVKEEEEKYKEAMSVVKALEIQVKGYHGLPQDTDLARLELEGLRAELRELTRQRDNMFEGLVERESPKKRS